MQSVKDQPTRERFGLAIFPAVVSRAYLARALADLGEFDEGDAHGHEAIRIAETLDHPFSISLGCFHLAYLKRVRGELAEAVRLLERAVAQCREWNITSHTPIAMAFLGHAYALSGGRAEGGLGQLYRRMGQPEQAHEHLTTATTLYSEMGMRYWLEQLEKV